MLRLGADGLAWMLPSPESGLRCMKLRAIERQPLVASPKAPPPRHVALGSDMGGAGSVELRSSGSLTNTGSIFTLWANERKMHLVTGAAALAPYPLFSR